MIRADDIAGWVRSAQQGNPQAWDRLVAEFTPRLRSVIRGYGLRPDDVDDAMQLTWMRAWASIGTVHEPAAIAGWLATTARRTAMRVRQHALREIPVDEVFHEQPVRGPSLEDEVILAQRAAALRRAVRRLPGHQRTVLEALLADQAGPYRDIAGEIGVPIGSIGPTRARSVARLRNDAELLLAVAG
jgi:RNA polymerase sigma factor (sigma-70 family)